VVLTDPRTDKEEKALPTDADSLWVGLRHKHTAGAGAGLSAGVVVLTNNSPDPTRCEVVVQGAR
jgi:hypothetical protein